VLTALPDPRRRPSDGVLIKASILARLLGIRLLKLDATVVVVPAQVAAPSSAPQDRRPVASRGAAPARPVAIGGGLAAAVRSIDEGAEILAEARRDGPR
jgi:hypothetical protein